MAIFDGIVVNNTTYDLRDANAVRFNEAQTLTDAQKMAARDNIGSASQADVTDLKSALEERVAIKKNAEGYYISLTTDPVDLNNPGASSTGLSYSITNCAEGDQFIINAEGATNGRAWGFLNNSNSVITMADPNATVTNLELTAPANAVKLVINDKSGSTSYKVGKNLINRVSALENDVNDIEEQIAEIEPGLSEEAKEALLACFAHVVWVDEHGQDYYDALEESLNGEIPTVKVFIGKGTSGANIIDNPKRALTEPIPFENVVPITVQRTDADDGYRCGIKFCVDSQTIDVLPQPHSIAFFPGDVETPEGLQAGWIYSANVQTLYSVDLSTSPVTYVAPSIYIGETDNTIRIMFASYNSLSDDLPENAPRGYIIVQGKKYKLEVGDNNEFV